MSWARLPDRATRIDLCTKPLLIDLFLKPILIDQWSSKEQ
jgi:hypothetical protein